MGDVTRILSALNEGDPRAAEELLPLVYDELRKLAATYMDRESPGHTLQATALVHEAFLRLLGSGEDIGWNSRGHFFGAAAEAMRRILIENARRKQRRKHGGGRRRVSLDMACDAMQVPSEELLALDEALTRFAAVDPVKAKLVELRFFAGMTIPETAAAMGISTATANRYWTFARAWLYAELKREDDRDESPERS